MGSRQKRQYADLSQPRLHWNLRVELPEDGMRLDRFLRKRVKWRSRTELQGMIDDGRVTVDGERRKNATRLRDGMTVVIRLPEAEEDIDPATIPLEVLHDDGLLMLINKQPGIVVHPVGRHQLDNILSALHARHRRPDDPEHDRVPHVCHRIDRDTSGAFLVAFDEKVKADVSMQFEDREVEKEYLALVHGVPDPAEGEIDGAIQYREEAQPRLRVHEDGLPSRTLYRVEEAFVDRECALVRFFPRTGRTHQIRLHATHIGHPLLCDHAYGGRGPVYRGTEPPDEEDESAEPLLDRVALHSSRLRLRHPATGLPVEFGAPLADDMIATLRALREGPVCWPEEDGERGAGATRGR